MVQAIPSVQNTVVDVWQGALEDYDANQNKRFREALAFGKSFCDSAGWSASVNTVHDALVAFNDLYHMSCSDGINVNYHYEKTGDNSARMDCNTNHPANFDYGILYGIILKFRDENSSQIVVRRGKTTEDGQNSSTYYLAW